jgi:acyl-CoA hydrolase
MENNREVRLCFLAEPKEVNFGGKVHGGSVMKWIDQAGYACAVGWSGSYCVTVFVGGIKFYKPITIGNLVRVTAKVIYTGKTSMHIAVDVNSSDPREQRFIHNTHCTIVFVAVNEAGQPIKVKPWDPVTEKDKQLRDYAVKVMDMRKEIDQVNKIN